MIVKYKLDSKYIYYDELHLKYFIKAYGGGIILQFKDEFVFKNEDYTAYINKDNYLHKLDNYAFISKNRAESSFWFFIDGIRYNDDYFAKETNHLVCNKCNKFCKQNCF